MIRFPLLDAALEGFRLTRERPLAVGLWAAVILGANLLTVGGLAALGLGPLLTQAAPFQAPLSPEAAATIAHAGIWLPLLVGVQFVADAVLYTAVLRGVFEPQDSRFGYLRLGAQELRQMALWLFALVLLFVYTVVLGAVFEAVSAAAPADPAGAKLAASAAAVVVFLGLFYPLVRLSLAPSMTFAERRIVLFGAWPLSRGRFWSLVGCYAAALLLALAVWLLSTVVVATLVYVASLATGGGEALVRGFERMDLTTLESFLQPGPLGALAVRALLTALILAIVAAPAPVIYAALAQGSARRP